MLMPFYIAGPSKSMYVQNDTAFFLFLFLLLQLTDVNTIAIPLVYVLIHLEVQVGASQMGSCWQQL